MKKRTILITSALTTILLVLTFSFNVVSIVGIESYIYNISPHNRHPDIHMWKNMAIVSLIFLILSLFLVSLSFYFIYKNTYTNKKLLIITLSISILFFISLLLLVLAAKTSWFLEWRKTMNPNYAKKYPIELFIVNTFPIYMSLLSLSSLLITIQFGIIISKKIQKTS